MKLILTKALETIIRNRMNAALYEMKVLMDDGGFVKPENREAYTELQFEYWDAMEILEQQEKSC